MKFSMFYLLDWFRSFLPTHNPIGFGATDFVELALAAALMACAFASRWMEPLRRFASRTIPCMIALAILPVALRLALLPAHPIPTPNVLDDFSFVLLGDSLTHFRFANPMHPLHQFFESLFVLQQPAYASIYPPGQGIALAIGKIVFGNFWAGVAISIGALCALSYWMLRAWITPGWALVGGVLAALEFGPLSQWMNSFWGGAVSACAGCLVFGALPRLRDRARTRDALLLGAGIGLQGLSRPFESIFLLAAAILFFLPALSRRNQLQKVVRWIPVASLPALAALGLMLAQNEQVTGHWLTMPYMLSRDQYGMPTTFTFQKIPAPHATLTAQQELGYEVQSAEHGNVPETFSTYFVRLAKRIRFYRFFLFPPLYLALLFAFPLLREPQYRYAAGVVLLFALGTNFYPYFYSHYIAAVTCLILLACVAALATLDRLTLRGYPAGHDAARLILFLCIAHFAFWYGLHAAGNQYFARRAWQFETWDAINSGDPNSRLAIAGELARNPGKKLVFVRYSPQHVFNEWVYNAADMNASPVIWARDLGPQEDEKLLRYYPDRQPWLLYPDAHPVQLIPYDQPSPAVPARATENAPDKPPAPAPAHPHLHFEEVH